MANPAADLEEPAIDELCHSIEAGLEETSDRSDQSDLEIVEVRDNSMDSGAARHTTEDLKSLRCPICLETPEIVAVAACGHAYCHECVFTALSSSNRATLRVGECSLCRQRVRYDQTIYMEMKLGSKRPSE